MIVDWRLVAKERIQALAGLKGLKDSDGNPVRFQFREGALEAAALAASNAAAGKHWATGCYPMDIALKEYQELDLIEPETRHIT